METDRVIEPQRRFPVVLATLGLVGVGLLLLGLSGGGTGWGLLAVFPITCAVIGTLKRVRGVSLELDQSGISVRGQETVIPFEELESVTVNGQPYFLGMRRGTARRIEISHRRGVLLVPCPLNVPVRDFARFLLGKIHGVPPAESVDGAVGEWRDQQRDDFGAHRVWAVGRRAQLHRHNPHAVLSTLAWALLLSGITWVLASGYVFDHERWVGFGISALGFALLLGLMSLLAGRGDRARRSAWKNAALVMGPQGIALRQGRQEGILPWVEISAIASQKNRELGIGSPTELRAGIRLQIAGAQVLIEDVYERPLALIEAKLREYWRS